ncbi:MAG: hypothetical protein ACN6OP_26755 [Pseudomonadales bacterium]
MAAIGGLHLGAMPDDVGQVFPTVIACKLRQHVETSIKGTFEDGWEVEALASSEYICARHLREMGADEAHKLGIAALNKALDLRSVQSNQHLALATPGDDFITLYKSSARQILLFATTTTRNISVLSATTIMRTDGTIERPESQRGPVWNRAFRYYRLSQLAADPYDAYRNLYLAFETLMEQLFPRFQNEREGKWVRRCFTNLHQQHDLKAFAPAGHKAPSEFLFGTLYESIRCNLFHSSSAKTILPYYETDSSKLLSAYQILLSIWRTVSANHLRTSVNGDVITYRGFATMMAALYQGSLAFKVTADDSRPTVQDTTISPRGELEYALEEVRYRGEAEPGVVRINVTDRHPRRIPKFHRYGLFVNDTPIAIGLLEGLDLAGVDEFNVRYSDRLVQGNQPRVRFG